MVKKIEPDKSALKRCKVDKADQKTVEQSPHFSLLEIMERGGQDEPSIIPRGQHTSSNSARTRTDFQEKGRPDPN